MKKLSIYCLIIFSLTIALSGCLEQVIDFDKEPVSNNIQGLDNVSIEDKGPSQGGFLNLFMLQPGTFDKNSEDQIISQLSEFVFEGLFSENKDGVTGKKLVDTYYLSGDDLILDIKLKDNVLFHDGKILTSDDVTYSVETIKSIGSRSLYYYNVENIESVKALDRLNLRIIFKKPDKTFNRLTFPIVAIHSIGDRSDEGQSELKIIGTGPFRFDSYKDNMVTLLRNDSWWRLQDDNGMDHPIWPDGIIFSLYSDESEMMQAFLKKEIDIAYLEEGRFEDYTNRSDIFCKTYESNHLEFLALSNKGRINSPVSQESFRTIIINYLSWYATTDPLIKGESALKYQSASSENAERQSFLKMFEEAGYVYKSDKNLLVFYKNGSNIPVTLSLEYNGVNTDRKIASEWIKTALFKIGIEVIPEAESSSEQLSSVKSGKFDMILLGCRLPYFAEEEEIIGMIKESIYLSGHNSVILPLNTKSGAVLYHNRIRGNKTPKWQNIYSGWENWYIVE